jgi:hypothetical protein
MSSILRDWVAELPLREQGTLLAAVRGCDLTPKFPLDAPERQLVAFVRWTFMYPADEREVDYQPGSFMSRIPPADFKPSCVGHYPLHWVMHIVHALEVIGYRHPDRVISYQCRCLYADFVKSFHLSEETFTEMRERLCEDRIAKGKVVS